MGHQVECVVCGSSYPMPVKADEYEAGQHPFTCSDPCQKEFRRRGGLTGLIQKEAEFKLKGR